MCPWFAIAANVKCLVLLRADRLRRKTLEAFDTHSPRNTNCPTAACIVPRANATATEDEYYDALETRIRECAARGDYDPAVLCWSKLSPAKCEDEALAMIAGAGDGRAWYLCVRSCATAGYLVAHVGRVRPALNASARLDKVPR